MTYPTIFNGLSYEAKPSNPPRYSFLKEKDTEIIYVYDGKLWIKLDDFINTYHKDYLNSCQ